MTDTPRRPARPNRLFHSIADQIATLIDQGVFEPGAKLPGERELAERFAVSRVTIREAAVALQAAGRVDIRPGSGVYVREAPTTSAPAGLPQVSAFELIAAASNNRAIIHTINDLWRMRTELAEVKAAHASICAKDDSSRIDEHAEVLEALKRRDAAGARAGHASSLQSSHRSAAGRRRGTRSDRSSPPGQREPRAFPHHRADDLSSRRPAQSRRRSASHCARPEVPLVTQPVGRIADQKVDEVV